MRGDQMRHIYINGEEIPQKLLYIILPNFPFSRVNSLPNTYFDQVIDEGIK